MVEIAPQPTAAQQEFSDRVVVRFEGPGCGQGPLSWGQWEIWDTMRKTASSLPIGGVVAVRPGRTVQDIAEELRFFLSRYESMRTKVRFDANGDPYQVLADRGEAVLGIVDVDDAGDPLQAGLRLEERWRAVQFDHEREWPIRMAAVRHRGVPTHVVVIVSHFATDGVGVGIMVRDLRAWQAGGSAGSRAAAMGPLELARHQREPSAMRQSEMSLRYWDRLLRKADPVRFAPGQDRSQPRYMRTDLDSPALYLALKRLTPGGAGADMPVLLAAYARATARVTGISPSLVRMTVNNRFRAGLAEVSHPLCLNGLLMLDVAQVSFAEAVERARAASLHGMKYAYYNPTDLYRLRAAVAADRGCEVDLGMLFNDQRSADRLEEAGPPPTPEEISAALSGHSLRREPMALFIEKLMVFARDVPGEFVRLSAESDRRYVSAREVEQILLSMEAIVVQAACNSAVLADAPRPESAVS
ncbi:MAG TPA: condensation domain-containing protein [Actinocrinis sp.]|uniref:condensation domain-containing protein n=1 Tax=Actinocrinis sp. TaxID=1920516 RepID=UPI002DDCDDCD|nr:condensation domain-containing protein [Actinocrinis sp.]HEV3171617.1 condensation domain-containing protein [Actinocrinis sp.]